MHQVVKHDKNRGQVRDEAAAQQAACRVIAALLDAGWTPPTLEN
jgi:hypothetical protein